MLVGIISELCSTKKQTINTTCFSLVSHPTNTRRAQHPVRTQLDAGRVGCAGQTTILYKKHTRSLTAALC